MQNLLLWNVAKSYAVWHNQESYFCCCCLESYSFWGKYVVEFTMFSVLFVCSIDLMKYGDKQKKFICKLTLLVVQINRDLSLQFLQCRTVFIGSPLLRWYCCLWCKSCGIFFQGVAPTHLKKVSANIFCKIQETLFWMSNSKTPP